MRFDLWMMRTYPNIPFERYADKTIGLCNAQTRRGDYERTADRVAASPGRRRRSNGPGRSHIRAAKARARVEAPVGASRRTRAACASITRHLPPHAARGHHVGLLPPDLSAAHAAPRTAPARDLRATAYARPRAVLGPFRGAIHHALKRKQTFRWCKTGSVADPEK